MNHDDLDAEFDRIVSGWDIDAIEPTPRQEVPSARLDPARAIDPPPNPSEPGPASGPAVPEPPESPEQPGSGAPGLHSPRPNPAPPADPTSNPATNRAINPAPTFFDGRLHLPVAPTTSHVWRGSAAADADTSSGGASASDDDHFVPDEPELPNVEDDPMYWAIVVGLVGGPLLLLYVLIFDRGGSSWWLITGATMTVTGFVMLVLRGSGHRDPFDDGTRV
ncbi:MAG: hypothetical protein ABIZ07_12555 [Dermatophilaceae bacterium]